MAILISNQSTTSLNKALPNTWRQVFVIYTNSVFRRRTRHIHDRGSIVPNIFVGTPVYIKSGNRLHRRILNRWMVGYKYGEFSWTRKLALYKAKQLKKKKKKK